MDSADIEERHHEMTIFGIRSSTFGFGLCMLVTFFVAVSSTGVPKRVDSDSASPPPKIVVLQPALPYAYDALAPAISQETVSLHYDKHQAGYVTKLNAWLASDIDASHVATAALELSPKTSLTTALARALPNGGTRNLAGQIFNHALYFAGMHTGRPFSALDESEPLKMAVSGSFGSFDSLVEAFRTEAASHFGSGWTWLLLNKTAMRKLVIVSTHDAAVPIAAQGDDVVPLAVCDVWEHAYYVDYRNVRPKYIDAWLNVLDWSFVARRFNEATVESQLGPAGVMRTYPQF
jgi:Fe-Mn family superoxide dismutase